MKPKKIHIALLAVMFIALLISACKKDKYVPLAGKCPVVESTSPSDNAVNVPLNATITVTFNENMKASTIAQAFTLSGPGNVSGTIIYDGTTPTMSFVPSAPLSANTTYTGRVSVAAKDPMGNALQKDYTWSFKTGSPDVTAPLVIFTDPINNQTGIVLNKIVSAKFNEPMNPATLSNLTFLLKEGVNTVQGTVSYSGTTTYFSPTANLLPGTLYTGTITTGAKDVSGNALANNYVWSFTTGTSTLQAPTVIYTNPVNNANNVPFNQIVTATFSDPMDPATISGSTFLLKEGNNIVAGSVTYAGTTASFTPAANLIPGATYMATITTGAKNLAQTPLNNNYVWTFSTIANATLTPSPVNLNTAADFGILAGVSVNNNAGFSEIHDMNVGIYPGVRSSITGFPPAIVVNGAIYASDDTAPAGVAAMLNQAKIDLTNAYLAAEGATNPAPATVSGDIGGTTLAPGIYKSTSTLLIQSGDLTLDAQGDPNAFWIFQIASGFTTVGGAGGNIILAGGAQAKNIFWQTGSSATIGDFTSFKGNILALTSITMNSGSTAVGRMLARNGSVVLTSTNIINKP
ncbi:MAG: Ig-like domain-containing protein [Bacteroidia bacterium]